MAVETDEAPITKDTPVDRSVKNKTAPKKTTSSKPTGQTPRTTSKSAVKGISTSRAFIQGGVQNPERVIAMELILAETIYIAIKLYEGQAPTPRVMAALLAVYAILGLITIAGGEWGRVAYLFGALVLVAIAFNKEASAAAAKLGVSGPLNKSGQETIPINTTAAKQTIQTLIQTAALG